MSVSWSHRWKHGPLVHELVVRSTMPEAHGGTWLSRCGAVQKNGFDVAINEEAEEPVNCMLCIDAEARGGISASEIQHLISNVASTVKP